MSNQARVPAQSTDQGGRQMTASQPNLKIGDMLQLQFVDQPDLGRFPVKVIGHNESLSLIITAPANTNGSLLLLQDGVQFVVRTLSGKTVMAFQAEVLKSCMVPYPYVHLCIQRAPERMDVRDAHRVHVDLIASVKGISGDSEQQSEDTSQAASIVDISTTGCLIRLTHQLADETHSVNLSLKFDIAEHTRTLQLEAVICSHRESEDEETGEIFHLYGVQFGEIEDDRRLMLYCFVYEQIGHED